jgi:hypothetical protein
MDISADSELAIQIQVALREADSERLDQQTRQLCRDLRDVQIESRTLSIGDPPLGTKSPSAVTVGALVVAILPHLVFKLVQVLNAWISGREGRKLTIKSPNGLIFEFSGPLTPPDVAALAERLLTQTSHSQPGRLDNSAV